MSNKKKIITTKELARSLGNKTPVQLVTSMASKKHGKYHLNGSKAEKKIAKAACPHHIVDKHGKLKPYVEYSDGNKKVRCILCGQVFPTSFFEDATVNKRTDGLKEVVSQSKMLTTAIGGDRDTAMFLTSMNLQLNQFPKVYSNLRNVAEKADRNKKKKKNKKKAQNYGGWYQN